MNLSEIHDCDKCHGKMVLISVDNLGVTRCSYCGRIVNYKPALKRMEEKWKELVKNGKLKEKEDANSATI